jgi:DNA-binding PucR family transcriptional regulator
LAIAKALGDGGVLIYELLGGYGLLFEISDQDVLKEFVRARIGPLLEHDAKKTLSLTDTLEKYLKTGGSLKETAQALYIHVATLKYRLGRIQELLNVDLKQPENHFDLQLALYANRVLKA